MLRQLLVTSFALAAPVAAQRAPTAVWDSVGRILQTAPAPQAGYVRYNFPRRDITLRLGDVTVAPPMALGTWAGFSGPPNSATMMGDIVLLSAELKPVLAELARQGIAVSAIHNHLAGESPQITYAHFHADGNALDLATRLDRALTLTAVPRPVAAQLSWVLVPGKVTMHGKTVVPALGYGTPINIQMVDTQRAVATGDFSVLASRVDPVLDALASHGITGTAVHTHLVGETPKIYYIHFWADGLLDDVLSGLRAALDAGRATAAR
jgi:hypothetical protein